MSGVIGGFYVNVKSILVWLLEIDLVYFLCVNDLDEGMVLDEDGEFEDGVKYFDMFLDEGLEDICRFVV